MCRGTTGGTPRIGTPHRGSHRAGSAARTPPRAQPLRSLREASAARGGASGKAEDARRSRGAVPGGGRAQEAAPRPGQPPPVRPPGALPSRRGPVVERLRGYAVTARGGAGGGTHRAAGTGRGTAPAPPSPGGCRTAPRRAGAGRRAAADGRAAARGWRAAGGAAAARDCAAAPGSCPPGSRAAWPRGAARRRRRGGGRPAAARCRAAPAPSCRRADGDRRAPRAAAGDGMESGRVRRWLRPLGAAPGPAPRPQSLPPRIPATRGGRCWPAGADPRRGPAAPGPACLLPGNSGGSRGRGLRLQRGRSGWMSGTAKRWRGLAADVVRSPRCSQAPRRCGTEGHKQWAR